MENLLIIQNKLVYQNTCDICNKLLGDYELEYLNLLEEKNEKT